MTAHFDIAVLGASLAGATVARALAAYGLRVALCDKEQFPRAKACGEGLSWRGAECLRRMGLGAFLADSWTYSGYTLHFEGGRSVSIDDEASGYSVRRRLFDARILEAALAEPNISWMSGVRVQSVNPAEGVIRLGQGTLVARVIIDATGAGVDLIDRPEPRKAKRFGRTYHVFASPLCPIRKVHILPLEQGELFCTPLSSTQLNVSFLGYAGPSEAYRSDASLRLQISRVLGQLGSESVQFEDSCGATLPLKRREAIYGTRMLRIGDACEQLDPIGGLGMTHALLSSEAAAHALIEMFEGRLSPAEALDRYRRQRMQMARPLRAFTALTYVAVRGGLRSPRLGSRLAAVFGPRLSEVTHHPERAGAFERGVLGGLGGLL